MTWDPSATLAAEVCWALTTSMAHNYHDSGAAAVAASASGGDAAAASAAASSGTVRLRQHGFATGFCSLELLTQ